MNKEIIELRLKDIEIAVKNINDEISQKMANLNMLLGGKQECLFWLDQMKEENHG